MHKSYVPKRYENKSQSLTIDKLLEEFKDELEFQRELHLFRLSMSEENEKISYLTKIQDKFVSGLFKNNLIIQENYNQVFKPLISESVLSFSDQIKKFNDFLFDSLVFDLKKLNKIVTEQNTAGKVPMQPVSLTTISAPEQLTVTTASGPTGKIQVKDVGPNLQKSVDYIKQNGVEFIFENIRKALLSGVGTLIQAALSFTGIGAIANEIAWGIMTLYDLYQLASSKAGALANVVIDLICLLTAGNLGKVLSKWVGFGGTSIKSILQSFMKGGIGEYLSRIVGPIESGAGKISKFLGEAAKFVEQRMGIKWLTNLVSSGSKYFKNLVTEFSMFLGKNVGKLSSKLIRVGVQLGEIFEARVFSELAKKSEQELAKIAGEKIEITVIKAIEKEANSTLSEKPTGEVLSYIDKRFGSKYSNLYAAYLGGKKLASAQGKIASGGFDVTDVGSDALRGTNTLSKSETQSGRIQSALRPFG